MAGGSSSSGTQRVVNELDPTMRPYVQYGLSEAQRLYQTPDIPSYYPGETFVSPSQQTQSAMEAAQARAAMGSPLVPAAQQQLLNTIQGQYLGQNPYLTGALQPAFDAAQRQYESATNQALSNFSRAGRYGSGAMQGALGQAAGEYARALTGTSGQIAYQNYADERAKQQAALAAAPGMAAEDYTDINKMLQLGQMAEGYQEMALADAVNRYNFAQQAPYSKLQSFLSASYGAPMGMQQTTPVYRNQLGSALAGALGGYAVGGTTGAAVGGLLGGVAG